MEFAKERGISRSTVLKWVKDGKIQGLIKSGRSFLIPEENLSIPLQIKKKSKRPPIKTEQQARDAYNNINMTRWGKLEKFSYDELKKKFDDGMTLEEIAVEAGASKQRISQVYNRYFAFGVDGYARRSAIQHEIARERELIATMDSERISYLETVLADLGLSMKPVQIGEGPNFHKNVVDINGHLCKIHLSRKDTQFAGTSYRTYSRFLVTRSLLDDYEFVIVITGADERRKVFIIPTEDLKSQFRKTDKKGRKSFYLPTGSQGAYRNIYPLLDWWKYQDAWHLLASSG
jgi:excisionase family DNA binding protein